MEHGFKGYHPVANITFFISTVIFGMLFRHPVTLAVSFLTALCCYIKLCGKAAVKSFFMFLLPLFLFVTAINGLFAHYGTTPLMILPDGNTMTLEAVVYGAVLGIMTLSVMMWFFCYNEVVTTDKFLFVFGRILPAGALVISMALRFIPLYRQRLSVISDAQKGIGGDVKSGNIIERIKHGGRMISVLITWSLENAVETSDSMRARGYGLKGSKRYGKFRWSVKDIIFFSGNLLLDAVLIYGAASGTLYSIYDPYIIIGKSVDYADAVYIDRFNLTINPVTVQTVIILTAFLLLCLMPLITDIKEDIKWRRSISKI